MNKVKQAAEEYALSQYTEGKPSTVIGFYDTEINAFIAGANWQSSNQSGEGVERLQDFTKVISDRINHFANIYHQFEANELHEALNTILRLVPPSNFGKEPTS